MPKKKRKPRKVRVDFKQNRQTRQRSDDWTQRYRDNDEQLEDADLRESVRAKGDLSRKRTILVDDNEQPIVDQTHWRPGIVTRVFGQFVNVDDQQRQTWRCTIRRVLRTRLIEQRGALAVGDRVWISDHSHRHDGDPAANASGVIERVEPRKTTLSRRDRRRRQHVVVANAEQALIVASVAQPRIKPHLIDRYLIAADKGHLRPIICFNKCDLHDEGVDLEAEFDDQHERDNFAAHLSINDLFHEFNQLGYRCIWTSATTGEGIPKLRDELHNKMTVLSGQSGVGKSSLVNALQPGMGLETSEVSKESEKGRHTTTLARLLRLQIGGYVIDTPGIRQFDLWDLAPGEIEAYMPEFIPRIQNCRFRDCHHTEEDGCAIVNAVDAGEISLRRYLSYRKILHEMSRQGS